MPSTAEFYRDVPYGARENFMLHLAKATNNIPDGEIRFVYVNGYIFEADGYMHGKMIQVYNEYEEVSMEEMRNEYIQIKQDSKIAGLWTKSIRSEYRRRSGDNSVFERRSRPIVDDRLSNKSPRSNAARNTERERETTYSAEEVDELVRKLKEKFYATDEELTSVEVKRSYSAPDTDIITPEQDRAYLDAVNR